MSTRRDTTLLLEVQGIESLLVERLCTPPEGHALASRTQLACLLGGISVAPRALDRVAHRATGGAFSATLAEISGRPLASLIQPRQPAQARLTVAVGRLDVMAGAGVLSVEDTGNLPAVGEVLIGLETFSYTGTTSTTLTGVTRALYSSQPARHLPGAAVYTAAKLWAGRKAWLWQFDAIEGTMRLLSSGVVSGAPARRQGTHWQIDCQAAEDLIDKRPLCQGVRPLELDDTLSSDGVLIVRESDRPLLAAPTASGVAPLLLVRLRDEPRPLLWYLSDYDEGTGQVTLGSLCLAFDYGEPLSGAIVRELSERGSRLLGVMAQLGQVESVQPAALLRGEAVSVALQVLQSRTGQAECSYDTLPGREPTDALLQDGFTLGAGLSDSDLDADSFVALAGRSLLPWTVYLDREGPTCGQILTELCLCLGAFWSVGTDGRVRLDPLPLAYFEGDTQTADLSATDRHPDDDDETLALDETAASRVSFSVGYNALTDEHDTEVHVTDLRVLDALDGPRGPSFELRYIDVRHSGGVSTPRVVYTQGSLSALTAIAQRFMTRDATPALGVQVLTTAPLTVGTVAAYENDRLDDMGGGALPAHYVVESAGFDTDSHKTDALLRALPDGKLVAPSAPLVGVSTTTVADDTIELGTVDTSYPTGVLPADMFAVGWVLRLYDEDTGASQDLTVEARVSGTKLRMSGGVSFTPSTLDWVGLAPYDSRVLGTPSPTGYTQGAFAYLAGADSLLGTVGDDAHRWA